MAIHVKNNVYWVGQRDWEVRDFHGTEYKTVRGSSYNSYLIREEKTVLIDTVDHKFSREFVRNLQTQIDLRDIDYIVINHAEEDHAGALSELMAHIPDTPIYCTASAIDSINGHHHHPEWPFRVVKTGDALDIGNGKQLIFVETPMLHWPDSMMTYLTGDAILFSNDAFGQHYCDEHLFNDEVDQNELYEQCLRYYANILTPFSRLVTPKIQEILGFNLPVEMIATSHGVVWRDNPTQIVEQYLQWAADYQEDRITIFYDTMSNNTRMMADAIAQGISEADPKVMVKIFNVARSDKNEILTHVFRSKGVLVGSSTMNNVMMPKIAGMLEEMTGLRFSNKKAAAFGSYGWNGGAVDRIQTRLMDAGFATALSLKAKWRPDMDTLAACREYGREIARLWALAPLPAAEGETAASAAQNTTHAAAGEAATAQSGQNPATATPATADRPATGDLGPRMQCNVCMWVYDPAVGEPMQGIAPGTPWEDVPDTFLCPDCMLGKDVFDVLADEAAPGAQAATVTATVSASTAAEAVTTGSRAASTEAATANPAPAAAAGDAATTQSGHSPATATQPAALSEGAAAIPASTDRPATGDLGPRMQCNVCMWVYDPAVGEPMQGIAPGTPWEDVPDTFLCPDCALGKEVFDVLAEEAK